MFFISAALMILELSLIRLIPAFIINFNFYSNIVLLACFLGVGLALFAGDKFKKWGVLGPALLLVLVAIFYVARSEVLLNAGDVMLLERQESLYRLPQLVTIALIFALTVFIFVFSFAPLAALFRHFPNALQAYGWNLLGGIFGICSFIVFSLLQWPPVFWMAVYTVFYGVFLYVAYQPRKKIMLFLLVSGLLYQLDKSSAWSPYYRVSLQKIPEFSQLNPYYCLTVNGIGQQALSGREHRDFYYAAPYRHLKRRRYDDVLIIGSGGGNDVQMAIDAGAGRIDAVEIDPAIAAFGKKFHPLKPYDHAAVHLHIADGRRFLKKSKRRYDLIIFALPDSLTHVSGQSSIRLESFLLTKEAFQDVRKHLKPDGAFVLYNYYWRDWLVDKIARMLKETFPQAPYVFVDKNFFKAVFITGETPLELTDSAPLSMYRPSTIVPSTDDWPFVYLFERAVPAAYAKACSLLLGLSFLFVFFSMGRHGFEGFSWILFLMGTGFMLLQTVAIARFMLLFGATWLVSSFVIVSIFIIVYAATWYLRMRRGLSHGVLIALTCVSILAGQFFPLSTLNNFDFWVKFILASGVLLSPVFFSSLLFSRLLAAHPAVDKAMASNLLGALGGGLLEYAALATGFHFLYWVILFVYLGVGVLLWKRNYLV